MFPRFRATKRYDLIEVQIAANSTKTKFPIPDQAQLRTDQDADVVIQAIETFCIFDVPLSPTNVAVATDVQMLQTYLTLYIRGEESIAQVPLVQLHRIIGTQNGIQNVPGVFDLQKLRNLEVAWDKCYFSTPVAYGTPAGTFATFSFLLGVHYYKLPPGVYANILKAEENNFCNID